MTVVNELCYSFLDILRPCQDVLPKLPKLVNIRKACIIYLLNFGTQFSSSSKYLFCR